ncbi:MAG: ZIP family metal transporter [Firmicutes bacterium]|nr:ZIP family metal transporter [Candidatus Fiminaster equi]
MENIGWIILVTFIAGVIGTGIGGLIGVLTKRDSKKIVSLLLSFAGGVMLAVVCFDLLHEAIQPHTDKAWFIALVIGCTVLGYLIVFGINKLIDRHLKKEVPHTSEDHPDVHDDLGEIIHADHLEHHRKSDNRLFMAGLVMAIVIALHNLPEGMVIGATYAKNPSKIVASSGMIIAIVIGLHNIPEGMAVSVPLVSGGMKRWKAVLFTALSGLPTIIGAVIGFAVGGINEIGLSVSLALASGAMLYVVFGELLPESILMWKSKLPAFMILIGLMLGFALVLI